MVGALLSPEWVCSQGKNVGRAYEPNTTQHRAEATALKASLLRQEQTSRSLTLSRSLWLDAAKLFTTANSSDQAANARLEAAEIAGMLGHYDAARQTYREILRTGSEEARCKALSRMARTYASTGPVSTADQISLQAMRVCEPLGAAGQAEGLEARGEVLESAGEHTESVEYFTRAARLFAEAKDDNGRAQSLLMTAVSLYSDGKQSEQLEAAGLALQLWSRTGNDFGVARARALLGIFAVTRGEFETAQCNYRIAQPLFQAIGNRDEEASVLNGLGFASRETGDWQKSLEHYRSAKAAFASVHDLPGEYEAIAGMGKVLLKTKRFAQLLQLSALELAIARRSGDQALIASSLADVAAVYEAQANYSRAETLLRRALETYRSNHHLHGQGDVLIRLGRLRAQRGQDLEALRLFDQAYELRERTGQIEEIAKIHYEQAHIYRRLNRLGEAKSAIEKTIEIVETQRVTIAQFDSRASYFASVHRYYAFYIELLMQLAKLDPAGDFAKKAFEASERSKVRSLLDLLTTSSQDASCGELLARQLPSQDPAVQARDVPQNVAHAAPTLTLEQVQAEIDDGETMLLEYTLGEESSFVWAVGRDQISSYELPSSDRVRKLVSALREDLEPPRPKKQESASDYQARVRQADRAYLAHSRELSKILLGPVNLPESKRLLIVSDGSLQYVPFAALPLPGPAGRLKLLVDRYEINMLPSASVLGTVRKAAATRAAAGATLAVFADPVFEPDDQRIPVHRLPAARSEERPHSLDRAIRDTGGSHYIPRLPASREEAKAIAAVFRSAPEASVHIALDFDANRAYVLAGGLSPFRLIHFATHGVVDARQPEMSGVILSLVDTHGRRVDGYLRMGDVYKLNLAADLVVLSSCDSALGKDLESEGIIGLPRAFLYAGARSVIASLWKVNDQATAKLMSALYTRVGRGESPGAALRQAQLEMVNSDRWSKPYYWAAFLLQGDYR